MGKKNTFLARQEELHKAHFEAGLQMGRQQIIDMMSIVLNDPHIMGKDVFGKERLLKVVKGIGECIDKFQKAWERHDDTDYYRSKMDEVLTQIYGDKLGEGFNERYEYCSDYDYTRGRWKK